MRGALTTAEDAGPAPGDPSADEQRDERRDQRPDPREHPRRTRALRMRGIEAGKPGCEPERVQQNPQPERGNRAPKDSAPAQARTLPASFHDDIGHLRASFL